jgi:hypothetical protein
MEQEITKIKQNFMTTQDNHKTKAEHNRVHREFGVGIMYLLE